MRTVIVGAGIAGLSMAKALQMAGVTATVVDRMRTLETVGSGIVIYPNGMDALDELGLAERVMSNGNVLRRLVFQRGTQRTCVELDRVWEGAKQPTIGIARPKLQRTLLESIGTQGILLGHRVDSVSLESGVINVGFGNGRSLCCDLLIAADGVRSTIRKLLAMPAYRSLGLRYLRFSTRASLVSLDESHTYESLALGSAVLTFGLTPLGQGLTHAFVQLTAAAPQFDSVSTATAWLQRHLGDISPQFRDALRFRTTPIHFAEADESDGAQWYAGPVALIGDAAHAISPTFQESASLGIEDAVVLGRLVSGTHLRDGVATLLSAYRKVREERVGWATRMSRYQVHSLLANPMQTCLALPQRHLTEFFRGMYYPLIGGTRALPIRMAPV
jgi:2-polyprenyl-6-methoxyphenol hydroxylase-like FAD-dependent oxidoreductase